MGRTLPTIVQTLHLEEALWKEFRRALRKEDQEVWDSLWRFARRHAAPLSMASRPVPMEGITMAMLLGLAARIQELEKRLAMKESADAVQRVDL
jgi:hypothetical protein